MAAAATPPPVAAVAAAPPTRVLPRGLASAVRREDGTLPNVAVGHALLVEDVAVEGHEIGEETVGDLSERRLLEGGKGGVGRVAAESLRAADALLCQPAALGLAAEVLQPEVQPRCSRRCSRGAAAAEV